MFIEIALQILTTKYSKNYINDIFYQKNSILFNITIGNTLTNNAKQKCFTSLNFAACDLLKSNYALIRAYFNQFIPLKSKTKVESSLLKA